CHEKLGKTAVASAEYEQVASAGGPKAAAARAKLAELAPPASAPAAIAPPRGPAPVSTLTSGTEAPTRLGEFLDARLSWTIGDDDILHATGQVFPLSPNFSIGDRSSTGSSSTT